MHRKLRLPFPLFVLCFLSLGSFPLAGDEEGDWITLFNGKDPTGWKANQRPESFIVVDGAIKTHGIHDMAHLYYFGDQETGPVKFRNFEWKMEVKTEPGANSGVFFHTSYQTTKHFLDHGYEAQVNNSHKDPRKTGSLYAIEDIAESPVQDGEWWEYHIIVKDKRIILKVNGKTTVDYTEPENPEREERRQGRLLNPEGGAIALQAHDPGSIVYFRNLRIRRLE